MGLTKTSLGNPKPGDAITASRAIAINKSIRAFLNSGGRGAYLNDDLGIIQKLLPNVPQNFTLGLIVAADETDNRYTVRKVTTTSVDFQERDIRPSEWIESERASTNQIPILEDTEDLEVTAINLGELFAETANGSHLLKEGDSVLMWTMDLTHEVDDVQRHWVFWRKPQSWFRIICEVDGGVAGDDAANCTFTYDVTAFDNGKSLGTGVAPKRRRLPLTTYKTESSDGADDDTSFGFGYYDDETLVIDFVINELPETTTCS